MISKEDALKRRRAAGDWSHETARKNFLSTFYRLRGKQ